MVLHRNEVNDAKELEIEQLREVLEKMEVIFTVIFPLFSEDQLNSL